MIQKRWKMSPLHRSGSSSPFRQVAAGLALIALMAIVWPGAFVTKHLEPAIPNFQRIAQPGDGFLSAAIPIPEFPDGVDWINTDSKLQLADLKGKLVLLDFWTYCCINCMHVLPVLDEVEKKYPQQVVVVGVHTAKFDTEKDSENIREAILRYEIRHPVFNDAEHVLWNKLQIGSWPTLVLLDPQGRAIWANAGEIEFGDLDKVLQRAVEYYSDRKEIDDREIHFNLAMQSTKPTALRFPGKVLADADEQRLYVADSNHNRIVVCDFQGKLIDIIGSGKVGAQNGAFDAATFNHPQGMAKKGERLFIADTENHMIREVDLKKRAVSTIAGTGQQLRGAWQGLERTAKVPKKPTLIPKETNLASPWDLWIHEDELYIAMAGTHQIWVMPLDGSLIGAFSGNGREDIVDGPHLPRAPYGGAASFAQPSGFASDGKSLFVADSEGSSIRAVPFNANGKVTTVVGTHRLPRNRLFIFGDADGPAKDALFQHPLGVAYRNGLIYVADTYNNKIREIDIDKEKVKTLIGDGKAGADVSPPRLDEPSGLSLAGDQLFIADTNNHRICVFDLSNQTFKPLEIEGLKPPSNAPNKVPRLPSRAIENKLSAISMATDQTSIAFQIHFELPDEWKMNALAPQGFVALWKDKAGKPLLPESRTGSFEKTGTSQELVVDVPAGDELELSIGLTYYFCKADGTGLCMAESSVFHLPVRRGPASDPPTIQVKIDPTGKSANQ